MDYNNIYLLKKQKTFMTLVVGAVCKDGVVIVADKKVEEAGDVTSQNKIHLLQNLWVGFSGAGFTALLDKFIARTFINVEEKNKMIKTQLSKENPEITDDELNKVISPYTYANQFIEDCEGIMLTLKQDYADIVAKYPNCLNLLVAFKNYLEPELHYIDIDTCLDIKRKTFIAIGSGSSYAQTFLKEIWNEDITMKQMANAVCFIIRYIEKSKLDNYVGEGVQALFVPKLDGEIYKKLIEKEQKKIKFTHEEEKEIQKGSTRLVDLSNKYKNLDSKINDFKKHFDDLRKL